MIEDVFPLCEPQIRALLRAGSPASATASTGWVSVRLASAQPLDEIQETVNRCVSAYPALRSVVVGGGYATPLQAVEATHPAALIEVDLTGVGDDAWALLARWRETERRAAEPGCRFAVHRLVDGDVLTIHHPYALVDEGFAARLARQFAGGQSVSDIVWPPATSPRDQLASASASLPMVPVTAGDEPGEEDDVAVVLPNELVDALRATGDLEKAIIAGHLAVMTHVLGESGVVGAVAISHGAPAGEAGSQRDVVNVVSARWGSWRDLVAGIDYAGGHAVSAVLAFCDAVDCAVRQYAPCTVTVTPAIAVGGGETLRLRVTGTIGLQHDAARIAELHELTLRAFAANPQRSPLDTASFGQMPLAGTPAALYEESLHSMIERQVQRAPEANAVVDGDRVLTYGQLWQRARGTAAKLQDAQVAAGDVVGIDLPRSADLVVAYLATLICGAAFLPLDGDYPISRRQQILDSSGARAVVAAKQTGGGLSFSGTTIAIDDSEEDPAPVTVTGRHTAYAMFTSGSTGLPKGALLDHAAVTNQMRWVVEALGLTEQDRVAQRTPAGFDASIWEIFAPLCAGASVVIVPTAVFRDTAAMTKTLRHRGITVLQTVPSLLAAYLEAGVFDAQPTLREVCCGGEALPQALVDTFRLRSGATLVNLYGPTEVCVDSTWWRAQAGARGVTVPIGLPVTGVQAQVFNSGGFAAAEGCPGELYLGGCQLAQGYLGQPGLTAQRFLPDPAGDGDRLYRTGDKVRFGTAGALEFLGRVDDQLKVRGVRIEPAEIETVLAGVDGVTGAAVAASGAALDAFVAWPGAPAGGAEQLRRHAARHLPQAMVPRALHVLETLPHLPNGKIDHAALRKLTVAPARYAPARDEMENVWCQRLAALLGLDAIGIHDDLAASGLTERRLLLATTRHGNLQAMGTPGSTVASVARAAAPHPREDR